MLKYVILLGLFRIYIIGLAVFWLHAVSVALFGKGRGRGKRVAAACLTAFIWPLALFSPEGRKKLLINAKQL